MPSTDRSFPRHLDELEPQWLSQVLGRDISSITATDIGAGRGMLGDVWRLELKSPNGGDLSIVAKFSARRAGGLSVERRAQIFQREIDFYRDVAPYLSCRMPRIFGTWSDPSVADFLILMEFVPTDGTENQLDGVSLRMSQQVMLELAGLHSTELTLSQTISGMSLLCAPERRRHQYHFVLENWSRLKEAMSLSLDGGPTAAQIAGRVDEAYDRLGCQSIVLCHADVRPDNLLFSWESNEVTLIDWQGVSLGPRAWDVGYFLAQGLRPSDRRSWQKDLLAVYLAACGMDPESDEAQEFCECVAHMGWYSLAVACGLFNLSKADDPDTIKLAASMGERAIAFLVDSGQW